MANLGEMVVRIVGDADQLNSTLDKSGKSLKKYAKVFKTILASAIVIETVKITKALIDAASNAEETANKFNVTFSGIRDEADAVATNLSDNFGLSTVAAQDLLSATGDLLTGFGFTQESALGLADEVNQLAVDLASFTNFSGGAEGASAALTKALLGERESVKSLGISILEADVQAKVLELTQQGLTFETERQAKAYATLKIAQEQSKNAIGDFARSQDSFANQTRIAQAAVEDLKVELGKQLLPIATQAVTVFGKIATALADDAKEFNNLKNIISEFNETGKITGGLDDLIAKRDLLIEKQQDYGREASLVYNEELVAIEAAIAAETRRAEQQKIIDGFNKQAAAGEKAAAEEQLKRDTEEAARAAQRLADIEFRNEIYGRTEAARIAAIEAEIAELETFKASDEKAQEALAFLREELEGLIGDTEEQTQATDAFTNSIELLNGEGIVPLTAAEKEMWKTYGEGVAAAKDGTEELNDSLQKIGQFTESVFPSLLSGFSAVGEALYNGEDAADAFAKAALLGFASILEALGAELAALAAVALAESIMGKITDIPAIAAGTLGAAAAYTAAGAVRAAATDFADGGIVMPTPGGTIARVAEAGQPEVIFPLDKLEGMMGGNMGGDMTIMLNIDGKKMAKVIAPYYGDGIVRLNI